MLEITAADISLLNDEKLREVVACLCEAELRERGHSTVHVTWGGNQTSSDGGIDVRVALPPGTVIDGYVSRPATGFQVKAQNMPAGGIMEEMLPKGVIRPSIQALADQSGAYVIVSSQGSTADTALTSRRQAMTEAKKNIPNADRLFVDFYDRTRVASWVRSHAGLIPWVRSLVGRSFPGWQSYGAWAYAPEGVMAEYLVDEKLRVHRIGQEPDQGLSAIQGLQQMRDELRQARRVVRLVGLSGLGKTRLIQALFDDRVGESSLDPALALYTNMADQPNPQPTALASNLAAWGTRAILVIDNCPPDLHHRLSDVCRQVESKVSIITVEYDIREDEPEDTKIFTLKSSSPELIKKLVRRRFPELSQVDADTIAEFSGGNARIAFALASTVAKNETVAGLTDNQLFQRLFQQRHGHDESLYLIAQACALVYSFNGDDISGGEAAELIRLGRLIGKTPQEVYLGVAELQRRDLVQRRGVWRAVLPPAIANRLAATALQNVTYVTLANELVAGSTERMMRSFSRRLGYLDTSNEAIEVVRQWLSADGLLGKVAELNELGQAIFENVAPVAPNDALVALERAIVGQGDDAPKRCRKFVDLLRSLAYDAAMFERAVNLLVRIVTTEQVVPRAHGTQVFVSLFHLVYSGTHATIEQRVGVIELLLSSLDEKELALGVLALNALLELLYFSPVSSFNFGAQSRDYGYWPRSRCEVQHWFNRALKLVEIVACGGGPAASHATAALAEKFHGLWTRAESDDEIARVCTAISVHRFWPKGWLAVRRALNLNGIALEPERLAKLVAIENALRPANLVQKVRAVVLSSSDRATSLEEIEVHSTEDITTRIARTEALAQDLGQLVAKEDSGFVELLPELVTGGGWLLPFGKGLAEGASDRAGMWQRLVDAFGAKDEAARGLEVLQGFLSGLCAVDSKLTTELLDEAVEHRILADQYPLLQLAVALDAPGVARLKRSIAIRSAPAINYNRLAYGRVADLIPAPELRELLLGIARLPLGNDVAIEILYMRLDSEKDRNQDIASELVALGRELIEQIAFTQMHNREQIRLGEMHRVICAVCLIGNEGAAVVRDTCARLKNAIEKYETSAYGHKDLIVGLFTAQPATTLDALCGGDRNAMEQGISILQQVGISAQPLAAVPEDELLLWCDNEPRTRYPAMANIITISERASENTPPRWTSIALQFLEKSPDPGAILRVFTSQFVPVSSLSGSFSAVIESNAVLLDQLEEYPALRETIAVLKIDVRERIEQERSRESTWNREWDERFE